MPHQHAHSTGDAAQASVINNNNNFTFTFPPAPEDWSPQDREHYEAGVALSVRLCALFGRTVVLVPLHPRSKRPVPKGWQKLNLAAMETSFYGLMLGRPGRNIAVLQGGVSGNTISLDFDTDEAAKEFVRLNPWASATLITQGARGCNIWVRFEGAYPKSFDIKNPDGTNIMEFRADGRLTVICGTHPTGKSYEILNKAEPVAIRWSDIRWPESWPHHPAMNFSTEIVLYVPPPEKSDTADEQQRRNLFSQHGDPFITVPGKPPILNQAGFAWAFCTVTPVKFIVGFGFLFYASDKGFWRPVSVDYIKRVISDLYQFTVGKMLVPELVTKRSNFLLSELASLTQAFAEQELPSAEERSRFLVLANGVLDLHSATPELLPFSPHHGALWAVPHSYDPSADCPRWQEFLREALPPDDVLLLQKWAGLTLSGKNFAQSILLLIGVGGAGKGVLLDIISSLIGRQNCVQLRTQHLQERFETARFFGKTLLVGSDVRGDFLEFAGAQALKSLTGGDVISAEVKCKVGSLELRGNFNVIATSNQRLRIKHDGDAGAWRRRLKIVEFTKVVERQDPDFAKRIIETEMPGILNWALTGLSLLRADFKNEGGWVLSAAQQARIDDLLQESDSIGAFVREGVEKGDPSWSLTSEELARGYAAFCDERGWAPLAEASVRRTLPQAMQDVHGVALRHDIQRGATDRRGYRCVRLVSPLNQTGSASGYVPNTF
jgi:P4 family phage/plasmid primase-like protien